MRPRERWEMDDYSDEAREYDAEVLAERYAEAREADVDEGRKQNMADRWAYGDGAR